MPAVSVDDVLVLPRIPAPDAMAVQRPVEKVITALATFEGDNAPTEPQMYDMVLLAVGRRPNGKEIAADKAGVAVTDRGFINVDIQMRTNVPHIFAIGDIVGQPMLAHKAVHEAHVAAEVIAGTLQGVISQRLLPAEGGGRVAAYEVLMANDAVRNLVREGKSRQLRNAMISGQQEGMQTIEMDLARLVSSGILSFETAAEVSQYPKEILAQAATMRSQMQAQATMASGQSASTGAGEFVGAPGN